MLRVNSIFYTIQGEGRFAGKPAVFIRLSGCNLSCSFCDTEFQFGEPRSDQWITSEVKRKGGNCRFVVLTGGEPSMQAIESLVKALKKEGYYIMIESNGMYNITNDVDWVCISPKISTNSSKLIIKTANEFKFVIGHGQKVPNLEGLCAQYYWISPKNRTAITENIKVGEKSCSEINRGSLSYCIDMLKENPSFRLNLQLHKYIGVE